MEEKKHYLVKDLIQDLLKCDQNAIVATNTSNFEQGNSMIPGRAVHQFKGEIAKKTFRDAFDYQNYQSDVVNFNENGEQKFIIIAS